MFNCVAKNPLPEGVGGGGKDTSGCKKATQKPVVLSTQRYEKVLSNAFQSDKIRIQKESEEEQKYREYLKNGSDELVKHFGGNVQRTQDQHLDDIKLHAELSQVRKSYNASKENEEVKRRERILKAQQLIEKLKPGPRELQSAALQSEVLRVRNVQRNINEEFERAIKQNEIDEKANCEQQVMPWIQEEQQRMDERKDRTAKYKQELMLTINEHSKQRSEFKKQLIREQQAARDAVDQEIKAQIEKEKAIMEKKRAALRKNALEAMKMVEQRRMRERMTDEVEDRLCCVYNVGKRELDKMKSEHSKQQQNERLQRVETNAKVAAAIQQNMQAVEAERIQRDINTMQLKFTAEEAEKKRKDKAAKQARIEAYMRELQQSKEAQRRHDEEKRFEVAQRYKNSEVNCLFEQAAKEEREKKVQELRTQFKQQLEEKTKAEQAEKQAALAFDCSQSRYDKDDRFFFEYAKNLIEDAQRKDRPLIPFAKAVHEYKRNNQIECGEAPNKQQPRHLISQVSLGGKDNSKREPKQPKPLSEDKEKILESCLKITEILAKASGVGDKKDCDPQCPVPCMAHPVTDNTTNQKAENEDDIECASKSASVKTCYSINELKKLNHFAAPPLH